MSARLAAIVGLRAWLDGGGASSPPAAKPVPDAPAALSRHAKRRANKKNASQSEKGRGPPTCSTWIVSEHVEYSGDDSNVRLKATTALNKGDLIMAVALEHALHARSEHVPSQRRKQVDEIVQKLRGMGQWTSPLVDREDEGRMELIVFLTLELLERESSSWWPYLETLPRLEHCAVPSLWGAAFGETEAQEVLRHTTMGPWLDVDIEDLQGVVDDEAFQTMWGDFEDKTAPKQAFMHAIGLVCTRSISGIGLMPMVDQINGSWHGNHNATIERIKLGPAITNGDDMHSVAAIADKRIEAGEEVILGYGHYSAAEFLYRYGWVDGGPEPEAGAASPHDVVGLRMSGIWENLTELQRRVLLQFKFTTDAIRTADLNPTNSPFMIPASQAQTGKCPQLMKQMALISACKDEAILGQMAETKRVIDSHGVGAKDIATQVSQWALEQLQDRCYSPSAPSAASSASAAEQASGLADSPFVLMALRVQRAEREALLRWVQGTQKVADLPRDLALQATRLHVEACKKNIE